MSQAEQDQPRRVFRGYLNAAQIEAEKKKFRMEITQVSSMPQKLVDTLMADFDRVTELQRLDVALGKAVKEADFKRTVKSILLQMNNHSVH